MSIARYIVDGGRELGACLLWLTYLRIQCAQTPVAVRLERAHAQRLGQGQGLTVGGFGRLDLRGLAMRVDLAEEPQGPGLLTLLRVRAAELQAPHRDGLRLVEAAEAQIRLTQPDTDAATHDVRCLRRDTLLQHRQGVGHPPSQHIRIA